MTDGTSQGLFIVVAIVIFGIFVVLAYILFEDTLSPAMASMFSNAIENTKYSIEYDGLKPTSIKNFTYEFTDSTKTAIKITGYSDLGIDEQETELVIPSHVEGIPVTEIGAYAFDMSIGAANYSKAARLTKVYIPDTVTRIGVEAFSVNRIEELRLSKNLTHIEGWSFDNNRIQELVLPDTLIQIGVSAFYKNEFTTVKIPKNVTSIGASAFINNTKLTSAQLPKDLEHLNLSSSFDVHTEITYYQ